MDTENHELLIKVLTDLETLPWQPQKPDISIVIEFQKGLQSPLFVGDT